MSTDEAEWRSIKAVMAIIVFIVVFAIVFVFVFVIPAAQDSFASRPHGPCGCFVNHSAQCHRAAGRAEI